MENHLALITGGAQGIGKAIALHLARQRYSVVVADSDREAVKEMKAWQKLYEVHALHSDISDEQSVAELYEYIQKNFGWLDGLVNNAGVAEHLNDPIETLDLEEWNRKIDTNLTGMFLCAKHGAKLLKNTKGSMVNIASSRALSSEPNTEAYTASKGGSGSSYPRPGQQPRPRCKGKCRKPGLDRNPGLAKIIES